MSHPYRLFAVLLTIPMTLAILIPVVLGWITDLQQLAIGLVLTIVGSLLVFAAYLWRKDDGKPIFGFGINFEPFKPRAFLNGITKNSSNLLILAMLALIGIGIVYIFTSLFNPQEIRVDPSDYSIPPIVEHGNESFSSIHYGERVPNKIVVDIWYNENNETTTSYYQGVTKDYFIKRLQFNQTVPIPNPSNASNEFLPLAYSSDIGSDPNIFGQRTFNTISVNVSSGDPTQNKAFVWKDNRLIVNRISLDAFKPINVTFAYLNSVSYRNVSITLEKDVSVHGNNQTRKYHFNITNNENTIVTVRNIRVYEFDDPHTYQESIRLYKNNKLVNEVSRFQSSVVVFNDIEPKGSLDVIISLVYPIISDPWIQ